MGGLVVLLWWTEISLLPGIWTGVLWVMSPRLYQQTVKAPPHTIAHTLSLFCSSICSISYRSVAFQLYTVIGLLTFSSLLVISPLTHYCCYYSLFSCSPVTKIVNGRKKTSLQDSADVFILHLCKYHCTTYQWCVLYRHTYSKLPLTSYTHSVLFYWFILVPSLEELCLLKLSEDKIDSSNLGM